MTASASPPRFGPMQVVPLLLWPIRRSWWLLLASFLPAAAVGDLIAAAVTRLLERRWSLPTRFRWMLAAITAAALYTAFLTLLMGRGLRMKWMRACVASGGVGSFCGCVDIDVSGSLAASWLALLQATVLWWRVAATVAATSLTAAVTQPVLSAFSLSLFVFCTAWPD